MTMKPITSIHALEQLYAEPGGASLKKVASKLTGHYRSWIERSRFCVVSTVGPEGTDGSPRGDETSVAKVLDDETLALPDWRGNNRIDTLKNIVRDGRISLMFMVVGSGNVVRINGTAIVTADLALLQKFERRGKLPRTALVISIGEVYVQCARAPIRAELWSGIDQSEGLPSVGQIMSEICEGTFDGESYDRDWPERARRTMW